MGGGLDALSDLKDGNICCENAGSSLLEEEEEGGSGGGLLQEGVGVGVSC